MGIPDREADLVTWTTTFGSLISATPTAFGLIAAQATAYATVSTAFVTAFNIANADATRTRVTVTAKNVAKATLLANARMLARIVQATPTVTSAQKLSLGLNPRDVLPSPIPAPANAPGLNIVKVRGRIVSIRLFDTTNPTRRGKAPGVDGFAVFSFVGDEAPSNPALYKFEGNITVTSVDVSFPESVAPGAVVWLTAFAFAPRGLSGPACVPVSTNLEFGGPALPAVA